MKKIENVIEKCNDCKHCEFLKQENGNGFYAAICSWENLKADAPPIIIDTASDSLRKYALEIPRNCPLETYKPRKKN